MRPPHPMYVYMLSMSTPKSLHADADSTPMKRSIILSLYIYDGEPFLINL